MVFLNYTLQVQAAESCQQLFPKHLVEVRDIGPPQARQALESIADKINDWLLPTMRVSNLVVIPNHDVNLFGSHLRNSGMGVPNRLSEQLDNATTRFLRVGIKDFDQHSESTVAAVFMHEFGHAVFNQHLHVTNDTVKDSNDAIFMDWARVKENPAFMSAQERMHELNTEWDNLFNSVHQVARPKSAEERAAYRIAFEAKKKDIRNRISELEDSMSEQFGLRALLGRNQTANNVIAKIVSHNEFFADLIVALYFDSKTIMADSLQLPLVGPWHDERTVNLNGPRPRDFSNVINFRQWQYENSRAGDYTNLDPARAAVFKLIEKNKIPKYVYPTVLKAVLEAVEKHQTLMASRKHEENLNATLLNQEFFRMIVKSFRENKLIQ